ncbi:MAG: PAS domain S-box protein [Spirochaetaceae bacterium]|nr:MAG: PAS domain S-box protein [Spirochaetaceae bacterium]
MTRHDSFVKVDLHCHSDRSDGYYTPEVVAELLARRGVSFAALTDHQTAAGSALFREEAARRGVVSITGAELFARLESREVHLLAYGFDPADEIMQRLFSRTVSAAETIAAVHEAHGVVVLAHPLHTVPDRSELEPVLEQLVERGLDGLEVFYKPYSEEERQYLLGLADRHNLLTTGGSDFHGTGNSDGGEPGEAIPEERWKEFRRSLGNSRNTAPPAGETATIHPPQARIDWRWLLPRIVLPSLLVIGFFVTLLFAVLIPTVEELLLQRKREMTAELTNSAWSILSDYDREVREGNLSLEEAQAAAVERIRRLRYGPDELDYFWITDMHPRMVMHPYRPDLEGSDLTGFTDPDGVRPFVEFVQAVRDRSSGYVRYVWQWQDDPERLEAKDSYVRGFEPWGWIIGTGLYEDDVKREIAAITSRMIDASFIVTILAGALLVLITQQSLKLERRRSEAERDLQLSHERYRLLVESSVAGTLLLVDGHCSYANRPMLEMLGYTVAELALLDLSDIITPDAADHDEEERRKAAEKLRRIAAGEEIREPFEVQLKPRDAPPETVLISSTAVFFSGRGGVILSVQDISHHRAMRTALGESRAKYEALARNISSGVFRMVLEDEMPLIEMNPAAERIFGLQDGWSGPLSFQDLMATEESSRQFLQRLRTDGAVRDMIVQVRSGSGKLRTVRLSAVLAESDGESSPVCDAIMEDISERRRTEAQRETLISQLQTSLLFLTEQVRNSMNEAVSCSLDTPVTKAVRLMGRHGAEAVVVTGSGGEPIGIVTDHDIRRRVVAAELDARIPVSRIMSAPVITISETSPVFEAFLLERNHDVDHLVVTDSAGVLTGIIRSNRTVRLDEYSPVVLLKLIANAASVDDLADCHEKLPVLVGSLVDSGASSENICHVTTAVSDAIAQRVIVLATEELGPPPAPFAFVALGSEAREEQTLVTDQDNAIIYQPRGGGSGCDAPGDNAHAGGGTGAADGSGDASEVCAAYFLRLGELVCRGLEQVGYPLCEGEAMARDARWNRTLEDWKRSFTGWIVEPDGTALAHCNVFFDLRCIHGDRSLVRELWQHVDRQLEQNPAFFSHMALNTLHYKPPIGLFGQIVTTSSGEGANTFDIKGAMLPIVNFARLYALRNHLSETNTFDRLEQLHALGVLKEESFRGTLQAYDYLMRLRYRHQVGLIREGKEPNNLVDPRALTQIESGTVKNTLSRIHAIQKKVSYDFRGTA